MNLADFRMTLRSCRPFDQHGHLLGSRVLTHGAFWLGYFLLFGAIWMKPETGYLGSYFLEFVLLPMRILAVYCMIYVLMPRYLLRKRFVHFAAAYTAMLSLVGAVQRLADHFFFETLFLGNPQPLWDGGEWVRNTLLVNSTVLFVAALRMLQLYFAQQRELDGGSERRIEIKADRRIYLLHPRDIMFIEGMGNYVTYHLADGTKHIVYSSLKHCEQRLPKGFVRLHRSYLVNIAQIASFNQEDVQVGPHTLPRGKDVKDWHLTEPSLI